MQHTEPKRIIIQGSKYENNKKYVNIGRQLKGRWNILCLREVGLFNNEAIVYITNSLADTEITTLCVTDGQLSDSKLSIMLNFLPKTKITSLSFTCDLSAEQAKKICRALSDKECKIQNITLPEMYQETAGEIIKKRTSDSPNTVVNKPSSLERRNSVNSTSCESDIFF